MRRMPMLDVFRNRGLSSVVYGVIIVATILVFVIQFNPSAGKKTASLGEQCAAKVRGFCIEPKAHLAAYRILIPRNAQGELLTAKAKQMGLMRIALDGLVERELLLGEADRIGIGATDEEVTDEIYNGFIHVSVPSDNPGLGISLGVTMPCPDTVDRAHPEVTCDGRIYVGFRDQKSKRFDLKVYERTIKALVGRSPTEFREEQARELVAAKVRDLVRAPIRVSEADALENYVAEKSTAKVAYVPVHQSYVARYALTAPTQKDFDEWMKDKANESLVDSTVTQRTADVAPKANHIRHILVKVAPTASADDKAIALGKLAVAVGRIKAGEGFAEVAKEVSDDTGSGARGGDVGDKTDSFVPSFKKAADALKPGEATSCAIETQFGYHYIAKDDPAKEAAVESTLKRDIIRELYKKTKALDAAKDLATKILNGVRSGKSPEDAVSASLQALEKPPAPIPPLCVTADEPAKATDAGAADAGALDATVSSSADGGRPPSAVVPKAPTALTDPDRPAPVTSAGFNQTGDPIPALGADASGEVIQFAFASKDGDTMKEPLRTDDGFVVVQLKQHKTATKDEFDKEKETYFQTLLTKKKAEALALYVKRLRDASKSDIKIDDKYMGDKMGPMKDGGTSAPDFDEDDDDQR
jgi:peptidyl-prolyl cis-trans isomerase D